MCVPYDIDTIMTAVVYHISTTTKIIWSFNSYLLKILDIIMTQQAIYFVKLTRP